MIKKIFPTLYVCWTAVLVMFAVVSAGSYVAVLKRFGVAPKQDDLWEIARSSGKSIPVFPAGIGSCLMIIFAVSVILIPLAGLMNWACFYFSRSLRIPWVHYGILVNTWIIIWILSMTTEVIHWYSTFLFD